MLREHVVSTALHALGVPTTRALAVVATGGAVQRETVLPGAVLARVAASHLRVGTFQYARATDDLELLRRLADHAIERHHPAARDAEQPYLALLESVAVAQAELVARWMMIGFIHGVLNTDNVTISGESIDFGPCAFLEGYDPATVFSSIDTGGRYAYGNQPAVTQWNLARFAEALLPLIDDDQERAVAIATEALGTFGRAYVAAWADGMRDKLGLAAGQERSTTRRSSSSARRCSSCSTVPGSTTPPRSARSGRPRAASARPSASWSSTSPPPTPGWSGGWRSAPTRTRWTGSTPSTSRATTWSKRRSTPRPPVTSSRCTGSSTPCPAPSTYDPAWSGTPPRRPRGSATPSRRSAGPEGGGRLLAVTRGYCRCTPRTRRVKRQ